MRVQQTVCSSTLSFSLVEEMVAMARMAIATLSTLGRRAVNAAGSKHSPVANRVGVKSSKVPLIYLKANRKVGYGYQVLQTL